MNILLWLIFGALVGWIASLVTGSRQGIVADIIVGIIGALIGGWIMNLFGYSGVSGFNWWSFLTAIIGAVILIAIIRAIRGGISTSENTPV